MSDKLKILCFGEFKDSDAEALSQLRDAFEIVDVQDEDEFAALLAQGGIAGALRCCNNGLLPATPPKAHWTEGIVDSLPDGVVLVDGNNQVIWSNEPFRCLGDGQDVVGRNFYSVLGSPEILGPDFCPIHTALATGKRATTNLRVGDRTYYQLLISPIRSESATPNLIVVVREITSEIQQQQKLEAIHQAGIKLTDLTPDEVCDMTVEDRIELLKSNILHYTQDLLDFNVVEIRLLDQMTGELTPLLAEGMDQNATRRPLFAKPQDNGVTGFVAATGKSYLCEDTREDPLYLQGFAGALSSLTVPLILHHEDVIGTFNVESPDPGAFSENDLVFLEIFARDVAVALNTLDLLVAQGANAAIKSVEAIHRAVALPIDQILNDTVHVIETYIGHDNDVKDRLKKILRNSRDIKELIHDVGKGLAPGDAVPAAVQPSKKGDLANVRVLVVDADESILDSAHTLLERSGCIVETARTGGQAVFMVRSSIGDAPYNVIISDVRLPDTTGHRLLVQLKELMGRVPLILMQGFGYDPGHSIVKARQEGLHPKAVLYKPFRVDQLMDVIKTILECQDP